MYRQDFDTRHSYATERIGISVPVTLKSGNHIAEFMSSIDTGAEFCLFRHETATDLGLDPASGVAKRFVTANSSLIAYGHELELSVLGITTFTTVYFFADPEINKNVLGRTGWLDRVRLALVHHDSSVYLAAYDQDQFAV